ncbi:hypothetical protein Ddc_19923 [Ditylenchus destructor]|nr:hypothetical protein Ddc_19923 [Ditylenchus destructor]
MIDTINGTPFTIQFVIAKLRDAGINGGCLPQNLLDFDVKVPGVANVIDFVSKAIEEGTNLTVSKDIPDLQQVQDETEISLEVAHNKEILFYQLFSSCDKSIGLMMPTFYYGNRKAQTIISGFNEMNLKRANACEEDALGMVAKRLCKADGVNMKPLESKSTPLSPNPDQ